MDKHTTNQRDKASDVGRVTTKYPQWSRNNSELRLSIYNRNLIQDVINKSAVILVLLNSDPWKLVSSTVLRFLSVFFVSVSFSAKTRFM